MYEHSTNILGQPQAVVTVTLADWAKFLGRDSSGFTGPLPRPGQRLIAQDGIYGEAEFVLAYGVASLAIGEAVRIGADYAVTRAAAGLRGAVGVAMAANTSASELSWYCVRGQVPIRSLTAAANAPLFWSATAGAVDDGVVATDLIFGAFAQTAGGATVDTKSINTVNGSNLITVPDLEGLYVGMAITGTGIPGGTTIAAIGQGGVMLGAQSPRALQVQLSANATATGNVTGTFAHISTYCTARLMYPFASGANA
jgi:hypothetical protein